MKQKKCKFCGWEWLPRVEEPKKCPRCQKFLKSDKKEGLEND